MLPARNSWGQPQRRRQCRLLPSARVLSLGPLFHCPAGVGKGTYSTRVGKEAAVGCNACWLECCGS